MSKVWKYRDYKSKRPKVISGSPIDRYHKVIELFPPLPRPEDILQESNRDIADKFERLKSSWDLYFACLATRALEISESDNIA